MIKTLCVLMLVTGITGSAHAQKGTTNSDRIFDLPPNYPSLRFLVDLGKGNKMQIELSDIKDLDRFDNVDSVIRVFLTDLEPFKDSLGDEVLSRRIDYTTDSSGRKKIRIQQFKPQGSSFTINDGDAAVLKLEQDTIHFIGSVYYTAKVSMRKPFPSVRYYRLSFFLNDFHDLKNYMDGSLNKKIQVLKEDNASAWNTTRTPGTAYLKADRSISSHLPAGRVAGGDFLNLRISVDVQNYKHYFVPSFSLGAGLVFSNAHFKRDIMLSWDPHYFFAKNNQGQLQTFRNDLLTLTWGQGPIRDNDPLKESYFLFIMSFSYLVHREGDYFQKNTFRIGAGRLSLFEGKTKIEPALYFDHFFRRVTPGLRWIQSF